jgi:hypothetical protein
MHSVRRPIMCLSYLYPYKSRGSLFGGLALSAGLSTFDTLHRRAFLRKLDFEALKNIAQACICEKTRLRGYFEDLGNTAQACVFKKTRLRGHFEVETARKNSSRGHFEVENTRENLTRSHFEVEQIRENSTSRPLGSRNLEKT